MVVLAVSGGHGSGSSGGVSVSKLHDHAARRSSVGGLSQ